MTTENTTPPTTKTFKRGDVVQLNSGGPKMTVASASANGEVRCQWFDKNAVLHFGSFMSDVLT